MPSFLPPKAPNGVSPVDAKSISLRCPYCGRNGTFTKTLQHDAQWQQIHSTSQPTSAVYMAGIRRCPAEDCGGVVYVRLVTGELVESYPPQTVDFDATNLPTKIKDSLEEAIKCHAAGCFRASALMVRRALEELCEDRSATGGNLKTRLAALGTKVVIPTELLDAADELRLLGNDAAHVEAKEYDNIGKPEVEAALLLAKEILKGVYQYSNLVKTLRALKKPVP